MVNNVVISPLLLLCPAHDCAAYTNLNYPSWITGLLYPGFNLQPNISHVHLTPEDNIILLNISSSSDKLLVFTLIAVIAILFLCYFIMQLRFKEQTLMATYITEKKIAQKVHDEIANDIFSTINELSEADEIPDNYKSKLLDNLEKIYGRTRDISRETSAIDTGRDFQDSLKALIGSYSGRNTNIIIKGLDMVDWEGIEAVKKVTVYRCIQELLVNMKKHSEASVAVLDFKVENENIKVRYTDNGKGNKSKKLNTGNGLLNISEKMRSIDGTTTFGDGTSTGFCITISFPAPTIYAEKNFNC